MDTMPEKLKSILSAVLFASGEPVASKSLAEITGSTRDTVITALKELQRALNPNPESGVKLVRTEDSWQFATKEETGEYVKKALISRRNSPLSNAALEVLAIVAYNQPVTKAYVEQVRGVDSSQVISNLESKGLIEEKGRLDAPGRPLLYVTTNEFLRCFNLTSIKQLPELPSLGNDGTAVFVQETIPGSDSNEFGDDN